MERTSFKNMVLTGMLLASVATPAHAGISEWINEAFTFREDQKPRVSPNKPLPPKVVIVPNYDENSAHTWARHYNRAELTPVPYMDDSSMVMRPGYSPQSRIKHTNQTWPGNAQGYGHHTQPDQFQGQPQQPLGYQAIDRRDRMNWASQYNGNIYVGEVGTSPYTTHNTGMDVGFKTQVGEPVKSWKAGPNDPDITPRPGDFDYQSNLHGDKGYDVARASGYYNGEEQAAPVQKPTTYYSPDNGLPTTYTVQPHDTLSGISNQDKIYGDWKLWPMIYDANRNQIQDPDLIHPRQNLDIPRDHTAPMRDDARGRATQKTAPYSFYDGR